jgi:phage gp29-like protein
MEKWFDALLFDLMDVLLAGCLGCMVMEWLIEDLPEWKEVETYQPEEMKFILN